MLTKNQKQNSTDFSAKNDEKIIGNNKLKHTYRAELRRLMKLTSLLTQIGKFNTWIASRTKINSYIDSFWSK